MQDHGPWTGGGTYIGGRFSSPFVLLELSCRARLATISPIKESFGDTSVRASASSIRLGSTPLSYACPRNASTSSKASSSRRRSSSTCCCSSFDCAWELGWVELVECVVARSRWFSCSISRSRRCSCATCSPSDLPPVPAASPSYTWVATITGGTATSDGAGSTGCCCCCCCCC